MCIPKQSTPAPTLPPPLPPPSQASLPAQSEASRAARGRERRRRRATFGPAATLLTGGQGLGEVAEVGAKRLLGE